jgi:16S rRNA (cytidine1402-2'-O)-methyltransferase
MFIETPYRNMQLFETLLKTLQPNTRLCVGADLSLPTEWLRTQTVGEWQKSLKSGGAEMTDLNKRPTMFLFLASV